MDKDNLRSPRGELLFLPSLSSFTIFSFLFCYFDSTAYLILNYILWWKTKLRKHFDGYFIYHFISHFYMILIQGVQFLKSKMVLKSPLETTLFLPLMRKLCESDNITLQEKTRKYITHFITPIHFHQLWIFNTKGKNSTIKLSASCCHIIFFLIYFSYLSIIKQMILNNGCSLLIREGGMDI